MRHPATEERNAQGLTYRGRGYNRLSRRKIHQVCDIWPQKKEMHRVRLTVGGDIIDYPGETATKNADLTTSKCLWISAISTKGAQYMCADVKHFYLNTILDRPEYMKLALSLIPHEIIDMYGLAEKANNGQVYIQINKGMYGLPQAGKLANDLLVKRLAPHGYRPIRHTHGIWKHNTRPVTFILVVSNFGIKYVGKEHVGHLLQALKQEFEVTEDWTGALYCGITLEWNYKEGTLDLSMPGYVDAALHKFQHKPPTQPEHAPYTARQKQYGAKFQLTPEQDTSTVLSADGRKRTQRVVGSLLYYGRAVYPIMLTAISALASQQATSTDDTNLKLLQLLNYAASHPDASIRYSASEMILNIHSDAGYLNETEARSRAGGHFFMSSKPKGGHQQHNGALLTLSTILRMVVAGAADAEMGALFLNTKEGVNIRNILREMGHPHPVTPLQTDNTMAHAILRGTCKQQRSKAIDMRFYLVRDRTVQNQFGIGWGPSAQNLGDYFTKHHTPARHKGIRKMYINDMKSPKYIPSAHAKPPQGCVDFAISPRAPDGQHANTATTSVRSTTIN
jgi:hypothetical protein